MVDNRDLWVPGTPNYPTPTRDANSRLSVASALLSERLGNAGQSIVRALMAPGTALQGGYNQRPVYADGRVGQFDPRMMEDAANLAGVVSLGAAPIARPSGSLGVGGARRLPSPETLNIPKPPTVEQLSQFGRVEPVPLNAVRGSQPNMQWERFEAGDYGDPMFSGFTDMPVAVRRKNGEYVIFDGHHRSVRAMEEGQDSMPMYVIDAEVYDPANAGRAAAEVSGEEIANLLRDLGL